METNNTKALSIFESKEVANSSVIQSAFKSMTPTDLQDFKLSILDALGTKEIAECPVNDIIGVALKANAMGLPISKELGLAYIIAFKGKATLIPAVKGIKALAFATGLISAFNEGCVFEGELQNYNKMTGSFDLSGEKKSDKIVGYFAYIELVNGFKKGLFLSAIDSKAHALKYSKEVVWKNGQRTNEKKMPKMWIDEFDKMSIKTVVKMLLKSVPLLSKGLKGKALQSVIADDDDFVYGTEPEIVEQNIENEDIDFTDTPFDKETGEIIKDQEVDEELADALNVELKSGKHQGKVLGDLVESDTGYIKYIANLEKDNYMTFACRIIVEKMQL